MAAGRYPSVDAALDAALIDLMDRESSFRDLKRQIDVGLESGEGEPFNFEDVAREARAEWESERRALRTAAE